MIYAGQDEEDARPLRPALAQSAQPKQDSSLVLLHNLPIIVNNTKLFGYFSKKVFKNMQRWGPLKRLSRARDLDAEAERGRQRDHAQQEGEQRDQQRAQPRARHVRQVVLQMAVDIISSSPPMLVDKISNYVVLLHIVKLVD